LVARESARSRRRIAATVEWLHVEDRPAGVGTAPAVSLAAIARYGILGLDAGPRIRRMRRTTSGETTFGTSCVWTPSSSPRRRFDAASPGRLLTDAADTPTSSKIRAPFP
jgi:hypothetical protein